MSDVISIPQEANCSGEGRLSKEGEGLRGATCGTSPQPLKCSGKFPNAPQAEMEDSGVDTVEGPSSALRLPGPPASPTGVRVRGKAGGLQAVWVAWHPRWTRLDIPKMRGSRLDHKEITSGYQLVRVGSILTVSSQVGSWHLQSPEGESSPTPTASLAT